MRIHFIAIGGSAMHNLALALHQKGEVITGSDDVIFDPSKSRLEKAGLLPEEIGWFPERINTELDAVILGMHAKKDNPELKKAQKLGLKIYSYPEFLYEHSKDKKRVVIGGSHGKTTITAMILHVLQFHNKEVDYMVGAMLEGFDTMVHLTSDNEFIVLEGDEYPTSPLDKRPKFHLYKADIALMSGIAWDHINVFPTFENYVDQFRLFTDSMTSDSILIYNEEDDLVKKVAFEADQPNKIQAYRTPEYQVLNGKTIIKDENNKELPLHVFGAHNLNNLAGARLVCEQMGISAKEFYKAIQSFKGAEKRLEKIAENKETVIFKDYAHSPSKVKATTEAVRQQFPDKKLFACLELHTYSSLNADFLEHYKNTLKAADQALVFYSPEAIKIKRLEHIDAGNIDQAFAHENLKVYTEPKAFQDHLKSISLKNTVLLLMSSGDYGGLNFDELSQWI